MPNDPLREEGHVLTPDALVNSVIETTIFGGYSKIQVDVLLERAAESLAALLQENRELKQKQAELEHSVEKYRNLEAALQSTLLSSQKMGENMVAAARQQAEAILEEARLARAKAVFKMEALPASLRAEIQRLADARERMRDELAAVVESHRKMIENIPKAEVLAGDFINKAVESPVLHTESEALQRNDTVTPERPVCTDNDAEDGYDQNEELGYVNL